MFVVNNKPPVAAPAVQRQAADAPAPTRSPAATPAQSPFENSSFETRGATTPNASRSGEGYVPTNAEIFRPTTASVVNITNGERQPLNPGQMSSEQGVSFVQQRLAALGFAGSGTASNSTSPSTGPFRIDYGADDRRHWDIGGINVGLAMQLYANNPPDVADRMLAADMQHARRGPASWEVDGAPQIPAQLTAPAARAPAAFAPMRFIPGTDLGAAAREARPTGSAYLPTREELSRPTTAVSLNIRTGERVPLNPAQMATEQGVAFMRERLAALGYAGAGNASNQTAPQAGPFGIDYGNDDRRHWDIDGMNVALTLQLYANNPREVADRMLADMLRTK